MMENKAEWLTDKYIGLMLLVFPVWTGFSGYSNLTFSKFLFFTAATVFWFAGLFYCLVKDRPKIRVPRLALCAVVAFMLAACLSALFSPFGSVTVLGASRWDGLLTLLLYGAVFLGVSAFGKPKKIYVYLLAASSLVCGGVAVLQLWGVNAFWLFPEGFSYYDSGLWYSGAFLGTIGNTDVLAAYFSLCVPLFIGTALSSRSRRDALLLIPAALCVFVLAKSRVASGILALVVCALIASPYYVNLIARRKAAVLTAAAVSVLLAIAGIIAIYNWKGTAGTLYEFSRVLHGEAEGSFGSSRLLIWRDALSLVKERPMLGGGPDTLTLRTALGFSRTVAETGVTLSNHVDNAHNEYLNYLVNIGLLGLLPYLALCASALFRTLKGAAPAFGCALLCYFVQSFFGLGLCIIVPLVWIFLGLLHAPGPSESDSIGQAMEDTE